MHFRLLFSQLIRPVRFTTPSLLLLDPLLPRGNAGLLLVPLKRSPRNERRNPLRILPGARLCLGLPGKFLLLVFLVSLFLFFILTFFFLSYFCSAPLSVKPGGPSMTSRPIRPPSPPPADDTRIPSPIRPASPPAPNRSPVRRDVPETASIDLDSNRPSEVFVEPAAPSMGPSAGTEPPSTPAVSTAIPPSAEKLVIPAPSATLSPAAPKDSVPNSEAPLPADAPSKEKK